MSLILEALKKAQKIKIDHKKQPFSINLPWISQWKRGVFSSRKKLFFILGVVASISLLAIYYYNLSGFSIMAKRPMSLPPSQPLAVLTQGPLTLKEVIVDSMTESPTLREVPKPLLQNQAEKSEATPAKVEPPKKAKILPEPTPGKIDPLPSDMKASRKEAVDSSLPTPGKIEPSPLDMKVARKEAEDFSLPAPEPKKDPVQTKEEQLTEKRLSIQNIPAGEATHYFNLGLLYHKNNKLSQAIEEYKTAIQIDPLNVGAHNNLGMAYKDSGRYEEAISQYQKALSIDPKYEKARHNLAVAFYQQGNFERAESEFDLAIASNPRRPESYNNLGLLYRKLKKDHEAREVFRKGLSMDPKYPPLHYNLAITLEEEGNLVGATFHYQKFVEFSAADQKVLIAKVKRHLESLSYEK